MTIAVSLPPGQLTSRAVYDSARVTGIHESSVDVVYQSDHSIERNVSFERIKLSVVAPHPDMLLSAFRDIINRIMKLTPNRKDFTDKLAEALDEELYSQMIVNDALGVKVCVIDMSMCLCCCSLIQKTSDHSILSMH